MTFNKDRSFEVDHGIILNNSTGLFSGNGSPVGTQANIKSYYFDNSTGNMWFKWGSTANDWRRVRPEFVHDHNVLLTTPKDGYSFNKNNPERLAMGHVEGSSNFPNNTGFEFYVLASQSGTSSIQVRLYNVTSGQVMAGPITFTETVPTLKKTTITNMPTGPVVVEVQGNKNGNSVGTIFWSAVESSRTEL